ncbi:MAG: class I SAM-dependent methyltransferase [Verrucomicrobiota bacterium]
MTDLTLLHPAANPHPAAPGMVTAMGGFPKSDLPLFLAGYSELCRCDLNGGVAIEICGGHGHLAAEVANVFPEAQVIGLDLYAATGPDIDAAKIRCPNLSYVAGDAFDLSRYADESVDLIWGQAALHHLAHDPQKLSREVLRVLKPGGRLVFIFEPMGHNFAVAAIRAVRMARHELGDESNLYLSQFQRMLTCGFSQCDVQMFNLLGYPMKALSDRFVSITKVIHQLDARLFATWPGLLRYGANCNVIFTK